MSDDDLTYAQRCARAGIPETTAEERSQNFTREMSAFAGLLLIEPLHAREERDATMKPSYRTLPRYWWRSLPDYDGGPMRAPSGFVVRFPALEPVEPFAVEYDRALLIGLLRSLGATRKRKRKHRSDTAEALARLGRAGGRLFEPPSEGGRGWCPLLAEEQP